MKKLITSSFIFLLSLAFGLQAQTLATFEDSANDEAFLGFYDPNGDDYWFDSGRFVDGGTPQVGANPSKSGINTSDKCILAVNVADADWWGNFMTVGLKNPVTITENNRYLHLMVYRTIQPKNFCIGFNGREDEHRIYQNKLQNNGTWENIVCDLGAKFMGQELRFLRFVLSNNWDDPRTGWGVATYAFDNFALSNSSLPPNISLLDGNNLHIGFENQAETDQWVKEIDLINASNSKEIIDNPFTASGVNTTGKVLKFNKGADASWWQGCRFDFNGIMAAGGTGNPQYLHVLVYVPLTALADRMNIDIQLCAKDHMGNENTELFTVWDDETDEWIDLVMEINKIEYLKELTVRYDIMKDENDNYINSPANTYYLDEIVFNKDANPRETVTGIKPIIIASLAKITASNGTIYIKADKSVDIQVYNIAGILIQSVKGLNNATIPVEKGVYIVRLTDSVNQQVSKVLVN